MARGANPLSQEVTRSVEFRASDPERDETDGLTLEGYAAVFDQDTEINSMFEGRFIERFSRGAFKKTLKERTPIMQFDHGRDTRTGSVPIGVYEEIREDDNGVYVKARVFDNPVVQPIADAIRAKAVSGMSIRMSVVRDDWRDKAGKSVRGEDILRLLFDPGDRGPLTRTIKEVKMVEAGPVVFPAYQGTSVNMRSMDELSDEERESLASDYRSAILERDHKIAVEEWLEAEARWKSDVEEWLAAESQWRAKSSEKPYGNVTYADPGYQEDGKKRYPLDTEEHARAAWSYINMPKNEKKYTPEQLSKIKARIKAALKRFGVSVDTEKKSADDDAGSVTRTTLSQRTSPPEDAARQGTSHRDDTTTVERQNVSRDVKERKMTLDEIRARIAQILERQGALDEEYRDAELPETEQAEFDELTEERLKLEASEKRILERRSAVQSASETRGSEQRGDGTGEKYRFNTNTSKSKDIWDLEELRKESFHEEDFVERARENARKALEGMHFPDTVQGTEKDAREGLDRLLTMRESSNGELAQRILMAGSPLYERAFGKAAMRGNLNGLSQEELRAMAIATDASGNFAVPVQLDPTLVHLATGYISPIRQLARKVQLVGKEWQTLSITEALVYRAAEGATAIDGSPTLASATVRVNKVHGFIPFSMEVDEDWPGMRAELSLLLNEAKAKEEGTAFMTGTGVAPQPEGLLTGATTTVAAGTGLSITAADIYKLEEALPIEFRDNAVFLSSKSVYNKIRQLDTAGGAALWVRIDAKTPSQLIGYPAYEASVGFPATTPYTNGQKLMVFGDFNNFVIIDRIGMSVELIPHLFDATIAGTGRPTGQRGLYAHWRNNSKVTNPNAFRVLTATT